MSLEAGGGHTSVMLQQAVDGLAVRPEGVYVDATFGGGGHSRAILARLAATGRVIALDRDVTALAAAAQIRDERLVVVKREFSRWGEVLDELGLEQVDGVLFDLGVSSLQLDNPQRGMSFRFDTALDMRMDTSKGETAADFLAQAEESEIERVVRDYGEERFAHALAKTLVAARRTQSISTTGQLAALVAQAVRTRSPGKHPATRCFQALRIHVNRELEELSVALPQALQRLKSGGRLAVISFHSLEDRMVKQFMRTQAQPQAQTPAWIPLRAAELPRPRLRLVGRSQRPAADELRSNPRARSATLRVAERVAECG